MCRISPVTNGAASRQGTPSMVSPISPHATDRVPSGHRVVDLGRGDTFRLPAR
jgi:hypothetical protein